MATSRFVSSDELGNVLRDAIDRGIAFRAPTYDELATEMLPQSLLSIIRYRGFAVRLSSDGRSIAFSNSIPDWIKHALHIHFDEVLELMNVRFLGEWR
jgi:hypothetical protein